VLVVGSGHSAFNALFELADLAEQAPGTDITWVLRRRAVQRRGQTEQQAIIGDKQAPGVLEPLAGPEVHAVGRAEADNGQNRSGHSEDA